ncbi:MAG TPA: DCC1-like thiol-disulfide oxidoreductase family protein [Actinospica sp.]|nr:DCC1-like thiol-disulfide oxidoreductase family protein [Actinospica sp.]
MGARTAARTTAWTRAAYWWTGRYALLTEHPLAARGTAALRIGYGMLWTLFLLFEFGEREAAWGPGAAWTPALERTYEAQTPMFGWVRDWVTSVAGLGDGGFQAFYALAIAAGVLFALGWRTRISSLLFCFTVVALENRSPLITDGGDNVLVLMSLFLCFTRCGRHWSLDARRRAARAAAESAAPGSVPEWRLELAAVREQAANLVHNGAVLVIAFQVCVIYATAGLTKVQGSMWQDGSAMGYVLRLHWFQPWPGLDSWLLGHALVLALIGYVTVFVQVGFPFAVFSPRLKYPSLVLLCGMHLSIAIVLGLPFFSLFMLVGDAVFLSDRVWRAVERRVAGPAYAETMTMDAFAAGGTPTLVFDGDCAFCSSSVRWAQRWCRPAVRFVPWQSIDLAAHGLTEEAVTSSVQWLRPRTDGRPIPSGAAAVGRLLLRSRWPFRPLGALLLTPPFSWLGRLGYRLVADNRYRLPGGSPACAVPTRQPAAAAVPAASATATESASATVVQSAEVAEASTPTESAARATAATDAPAPRAEPSLTTLDELFDRD